MKLKKDAKVVNLRSRQEVSSVMREVPALHRMIIKLPIKTHKLVFKIRLWFMFHKPDFFRVLKVDLI